MFSLYRLRLLGIASLVFAVSGPAQAVTTSYHIGNSLTADSQPLNMQTLAASRGLEHSVGYHIFNSASLDDIIANPHTTSSESPNGYGTFTQALPNYAWDIVTLQLHPVSNLGTDLNSILSMIDLTRSNPANKDTNFYIYQTWPMLTNVTIQNQWNAPSADQLNTGMTRSRAYYNNLIERVRAATDANVYMIPMGEVFFELDKAIRAGQVPGITSVTTFYRDAQHLKFGSGRFIASAATFATILGQYPNGLEFSSSFDNLTPVQVKVILEVIRDVLDKHSYSGVNMPPALKADFNADLRVDEQDLQLLQKSLVPVAPYDFNRDGRVDGRDFLEWQRNYQPVVSDSVPTKFDLNGDGYYDSNDLIVWQESYGVNGNGDLDGDGDTDGRDFLIWQTSTPNLANDINDDLKIDGVELSAWQQSYGYSLQFDANGDGVVNMADYDVWVAENGSIWTYPYALTAPPLASQALLATAFAVPEPSASLLTCGFLSWGLLSRRRMKS